MSEPTPLRPWKETDEADRAAEVVRLVSGIAPRPVDVGKGWDGVIERVARPKSSRLFWFAAACAAVLLAWVSLQWPLTAPRPAAVPQPVVAAVAPECAEPQMCVEGTQPVARPEPVPAPVPQKAPPKVAVVVPEPVLDVAPEPEPVPQQPQVPERPAPENVVAKAGAVWSVPVEGTLKVDRGHFEIGAHAEPYTVTTPEVSLVAGGARYAADVSETGTVVRVFEGEVEIFSHATKQELTLRAGEERRFLPFAAPSALDVVPPEVSSPACARHSLEQRVACLINEGKGEGLRAQAALYEAAYLQMKAGRAGAAELTLRESLRRFPHGVLYPEVRLALVNALKLQNRNVAAAGVAKDFLTTCPDDPRVSDVTVWLRNLEWVEERQQQH